MITTAACTKAQNSNQQELFLKNQQSGARITLHTAPAVLHEKLFCVTSRKSRRSFGCHAWWQLGVGPCSSHLAAPLFHKPMHFSVELSWFYIKHKQQGKKYYNSS